MLKLLVKKQLMEVFKSYFVDSKKNKGRSKGAIIAWFVFFTLLMVGLLGGMFTFLSFALCGGLVEAQMGWLYYAIMGFLAIFLGVFGSVFNTYAGLYKAQDNDLLLSMPIPVRTIMLSRLLNVYLMGLMYSIVVIFPAVIVYWIVSKFSVGSFVGGIVLTFLISLIVLVLSCILGWVVARVSSKLKNKSFITVFISLIGIAAYYFCYFKAQTVIQELLEHADEYGAKIKGSAYIVYLFGVVGEGNVVAIIACTVAIGLMVWATYSVLAKSFLKIATATENVEHKEYSDNMIKSSSLFTTLFNKEIGKFISSPTYMLNCGLGIVVVVICGVMLLIKGDSVVEAVNEMFENSEGFLEVMLCIVMILMASMNNMAAPSISLEGKNIWVLQSLPVKPISCLNAKMLVQVVFSGVPMLFAAICIDCVVPCAISNKILVVLVLIMNVIFMATFDMMVGLKFPNLNWTNETAPIKQSACAFVSLFGGWGFAAIFGGVYFIIGEKIGAFIYLTILLAIEIVATILAYMWIKKKGSKIFASL